VPPASGAHAAAWTDRDHDRCHLRKLLRELESDRSLSGDHVRVLEWMDESGAGLLDVGERRLERVLERLAGELGARSVVPRRLDLGHRRLGGHEDRRLDAGLAGRPGDRLPVVTRARGDDAGFPLRRGEDFHLVGGAADLERAGALERLCLQVHLTPGHPAEGLGDVERRHAHALARDALAGGFDVSECRCRIRRQA
jgi:hypothetical protein